KSPFEFLVLFAAKRTLEKIKNFIFILNTAHIKKRQRKNPLPHLHKNILTKSNILGGHYILY
ncbi:MAG: hypothetical protein LUF26_09335, partial [Firmicutes bacterium]|nr:hypothetical protein [Bacillota bacterium]